MAFFAVDVADVGAVSAYMFAKSDILYKSCVCEMWFSCDGGSGFVPLNFLWRNRKERVEWSKNEEEKQKRIG